MIRFAFLIVVSGLIACTSSRVYSQQEKRLSDRAQAAARNLAQQQKFRLEYKFAAGEEVRWNVEHAATTKAQISGTNETTSSHTQSTKLWKVSSVDSVGNITFVHSVESTKLWQQIGDDAPLSFDSQSDETPPDEFARTQEMIGKPLAVVTISRSGKVVNRKTGIEQTNFGIGDICTPMPETMISVGHRWYVPTEFTASDEDGRRLHLKARLHYQLTKIVDGKAFITFKTEVLTPIETDKIRSQLLQKLNDGYIAFDMEAGRLASKETKWNEKVQGYAGPDSFLQYTGRMTEKIVTDQESVISSSSKAKSRGAAQIRRPGDKPVIRK